MRRSPPPSASPSRRARSSASRRASSALPSGSSGSVRAGGGALELAGAYGLGANADLGDAPALAAAAVEGGGRRHVAASGNLPGGCGSSTTLPLGEPPVGFLQLLFPDGAEPAADELGRLATFGVRAAHVLRSSAAAREHALELERARALLAVVGQATAELSLAHTLETAVERIAELLTVERVAVTFAPTRIASCRLPATV